MIFRGLRKLVSIPGARRGVFGASGYQHTEYSSHKRAVCWSLNGDQQQHRGYSTTPLTKAVLDVPVLREHALDIFNTAVNAVLPQSMVAKALQLDGSTLTVGDQTYELNHNVHVVAFGKAVIGMVRAAEDVLGEHIVGGIASVPAGIQDTLRDLGKWDLLPSSTSRVKILEGAESNIPDEDAHKAAMEIYSLLESLDENDIVLALFSGGGSALLPAPVPPITLTEMADVTRMLSHKGATIQQLNTVRKHLELLKGGGLARTAYPSKVISLGLSNVVGNTLDVIASGPTVPDFTTPKHCLDILQKYEIEEVVPASITAHLIKKREEFKKEIQLVEHDTGCDDFVPITTESKTKNFLGSFHCNNVQNHIIGSNHIGMVSASHRAHLLGYIPYILSRGFTGEARETGILYSKLAMFVCQSVSNGFLDDAEPIMSQELDLVANGISKAVINDLCEIARESVNSQRPICIMGSGKTTLKLRSGAVGTGGRNQEMALSAAVYMGKTIPHSVKQNFSIIFMSADTDGHDGPTKSAGAFADPWLSKRATDKGVNIHDYFERFDSNTFFTELEHGRNLINIGHTGTNVMDIQILLIQPQSNVIKKPY